MPFIAVSICWSLPFYIVYFLLQWPRQFEILKRRSVKAIGVCKKGKRKVQGVPQSQTAALPRHQEEEETDKSKQAQRSNVRKALRLALSSPSEVIAMLKGLKKHKNKIGQGKTYNKSAILRVVEPFAVNSECPNQNVNCHPLWWSGIGSSSCALCQMEIIDVQTINSFKILTGQQRSVSWC